MNLYVRVTTKHTDVIVLNPSYEKEKVEAVLRQRKISPKEIEYVLEKGVYISEPMTLKYKPGKIERVNFGPGTIELVDWSDEIIIFPDAEYRLKKRVYPKFLRILKKIVWG